MSSKPEGGVPAFQEIYDCFVKSNQFAAERAAKFISASAAQHYKKTNEEVSPARRTLYTQFHQIDQIATSEEEKRELRNEVSTNYVRKAHTQIRGQHQCSSSSGTPRNQRINEFTPSLCRHLEFGIKDENWSPPKGPGRASVVQGVSNHVDAAKGRESTVVAPPTTIGTPDEYSQKDAGFEKVAPGTAETHSENSPVTAENHSKNISGKRNTPTSNDSQTDTNVEGNPPPKKYRTVRIANWDKIPGNIFEHQLLAEAEIFPFLTSAGPDTKGRKRFACKNPDKKLRCRARTEKTDTGCVLLRISEHAKCRCRTKPQQNLDPRGHPMIQYLVMKERESARLGRKSITDVVERKLSQIDSFKVYFASPHGTEKVKRCIQRRIKTTRDKERTAPDGSPLLPVKDVAGLVAIQQKYKFTLPLECPPPLRARSRLSKEFRATLLEFAQQLYDQEQLKVSASRDTCKTVHGPRNVCDHLLTILDGRKDEPDSELSPPEKDLYNRIESLHREDQQKGTKMCDGCCFDNVIVMSSVRMLSTLKDCQYHNWNVSVSADGTDKLVLQDYVCLNFGIFTFTLKGTKQFNPLFYCLCPEEKHKNFSIGVVTLLKYARRLFGISDMPWKGLLLSDRSAAFVNTFKIAFPKSKDRIAQCYPHIIRKFVTGRPGNGLYLTKYRADSKFISNVANQDVAALHACRSAEMFAKYASMMYNEPKQSSRSAWANHPRFMKNMREQYTDTEFYNRWYVGSTPDMVGHTPDNNPNERNTSLIKGTKNTTGYMNCGRDIGYMMDNDFANLIHSMSISNVGFSHSILVDDADRYLCKSSDRHDQLVNFAKSVDPHRDINRTFAPPYVYMNCHDEEEAMMDCQEVRLTRTRLQNYEYALCGKTEFSEVDRRKYLNSVLSICKLTPVNNDGKTCYRGSCSQFMKKGYCCHSGYLMYKSRVDSHLITVDSRSEKYGAKRSSRKHQLKKYNRETVFAQVDVIISTVHAMLSLIINMPGDEETSVKKALSDLPAISSWRVNKATMTRNIGVWRRKAGNAEKAILYSKNAHNEMVSFRAKPSTSSRRQILKDLANLHTELELIIRGKNTLAPEPPDHNLLPTSPILKQIED